MSDGVTVMYQGDVFPGLKKDVIVRSEVEYAEEDL